MFRPTQAWAVLFLWATLFFYSRTGTAQPAQYNVVAPTPDYSSVEVTPDPNPRGSFTYSHEGIRQYDNPLYQKAYLKTLSATPTPTPFAAPQGSSSEIARMQRDLDALSRRVEVLEVDLARCESERRESDRRATTGYSATKTPDIQIGDSSTSVPLASPPRPQAASTPITKRTPFVHAR